VHVGGVLDDDQLIANSTLVGEGSDRGRGIGQQMTVVVVVDPRSCHRTGTDVRADDRFVGFDEAIQRLGLDVTRFDEDRFQGAHANVDVGQVRATVMITRGHGRIVAG
jgi:hypothetical protein